MRLRVPALPLVPMLGASVLSGRAGYHAANLLATATQSAPAKKPGPVVKAAPGKLPLPAGYALLSGDTELWPTLSRALLRLKDGSMFGAYAARPEAAACLDALPGTDEVAR